MPSRVTLGADLTLTTGNHPNGVIYMALSTTRENLLIFLQKLESSIHNDTRPPKIFTSKYQPTPIVDMFQTLIFQPSTIGTSDQPINGNDQQPGHPDLECGLDGSLYEKMISKLLEKINDERRTMNLTTVDSESLELTNFHEVRDLLEELLHVKHLSMLFLSMSRRCKILDVPEIGYLEYELMSPEAIDMLTADNLYLDTNKKIIDDFNYYCRRIREMENRPRRVEMLSRFLRGPTALEDLTEELSVLRETVDNYDAINVST